MASSTSGTSSGSTVPLTPGSEGDDFKQQQQQQQQQPPKVVDQRRQKRMLSNRESARRSRMRKQKHLDDLTAEVSRLRGENERLLAAYKAATQQYLAIEADNSVMRAQAVELATRLQSLDEILGYLDVAAGVVGSCDYGSPDDDDSKPRAVSTDGFMPCPWIWNWSAQQPIAGMAAAAPPPPPPMAADMLLY